MAKFKYLRGGKVFESDKIYNLPQVGADGKLLLNVKKKMAFGGTDPVKGDPNKKSQVYTTVVEHFKKLGDKPVVDVEESDPLFYDEKEFTNYYRNKVLNKLKSDPTYSEQIAGLNNNAAQSGMSLDDMTNSYIALRGGLPDFRSYQTIVRQYEKSQVPTESTLQKVASSSGNPDWKPAGYRYSKGKPAKESITRRTFEDGGKKPASLVAAAFSGPAGMVADAASGFDVPNKPKEKLDLSKVLGNTAPFLDNLGNLIAANNTPNIPTFKQTSGPRLTTDVNVNPQLRNIENDVRSASNAIDMSTSSAGVAAANKGKMMADKWRALGDINANKQNTENQLKNQAAIADYQARQSNDALVNRQSEMQMMRTDDVNNRYAQVVGNFGDDIANINRERNLASRDTEALKMLMKINPDSAYQFADTDSFASLFKGNEKGLADLIRSQKGSAQRDALSKLYKKLFNKDFSK